MKKKMFLVLLVITSIFVTACNSEKKVEDCTEETSKEPYIVSVSAGTGQFTRNPDRIARIVDLLKSQEYEKRKNNEVRIGGTEIIFTYSDGTEVGFLYWGKNKFKYKGTVYTAKVEIMEELFKMFEANEETTK